LGKSHRKARKVRKDIAAKLCVLCELCGAYVQAFPPAGNWTLRLAKDGAKRPHGRFDGPQSAVICAGRGAHYFNRQNLK
jgi:hypothetical protein